MIKKCTQARFLIPFLEQAKSWLESQCQGFGVRIFWKVLSPKYREITYPRHRRFVTRSRRIFHRVLQLPTYVRRYARTYVCTIEANRIVQTAGSWQRLPSRRNRLNSEPSLSELHFVRRCVVGLFARKDPHTNSFGLIDSHEEEYISLNFRKYDPPLHPLKSCE